MGMRTKFSLEKRLMGSWLIDLQAARMTVMEYKEEMVRDRSWDHK